MSCSFCESPAPCFRAVHWARSKQLARVSTAVSVWTCRRLMNEARSIVSRLLRGAARSSSSSPPRLLLGDLATPTQGETNADR